MIEKRSRLNNRLINLDIQHSPRKKRYKIIQNPSKSDHLFRKVKGRKGVKEIERKRKIEKIVRKADQLKILSIINPNLGFTFS